MKKYTLFLFVLVFIFGLFYININSTEATVVSPSLPPTGECTITSTLREGSKGVEVMCLQQSLGGLTLDGDFGPLTKAAVMAFQVNEGLEVDGVFGPMSISALEN